jgi:malonyl-CoA/methylmalonyl-CoA synthetase
VRIAEPQNGVGIVEVQGPNVFKGYWNMPDKTKAEFRDDGYFITGDMGLIDSDGYVHLVGRAKDLIISGGLNVYPKEIEDAIDALDGVVESAVFAIPHPDFGEAVAAAVTLQKNSKLTANAIIAALRTQLAGFKAPKRVYVLDELPRNAMSKVQKAVLRERYKSEFSQD